MDHVTAYVDGFNLYFGLNLCVYTQGHHITINEGRLQGAKDQSAAES